MTVATTFAAVVLAGTLLAPAAAPPIRPAVAAQREYLKGMDTNPSVRREVYPLALESVKRLEAVWAQQKDRLNLKALQNVTEELTVRLAAQAGEPVQIKLDEFDKRRYGKCRLDGKSPPGAKVEPLAGVEEKKLAEQVKAARGEVARLATLLTAAERQAEPTLDREAFAERLGKAVRLIKGMAADPKAAGEPAK